MIEDRDNREIAFGQRGGVFYTFLDRELESFDDDDEEEEEEEDRNTNNNNYNRDGDDKSTKKNEDTTNTNDNDNDDDDKFTKKKKKKENETFEIMIRPKRAIERKHRTVEPCEEPFKIFNAENAEELLRARERAIVREQREFFEREGLKNSASGRERAVASREELENYKTHVCSGIPRNVMKDIEVAHREYVNLKRECKYQRVVNCLRVFDDASVMTRDEKGRLQYERLARGNEKGNESSSQMMRERGLVETRSLYQRVFDIQAFEECNNNNNNNNNNRKIVASRDFCAVSISLTDAEKKNKFRCEFSTEAENSNNNNNNNNNNYNRIPTDMSFASTSACGKFEDVCLRVANDFGEVKTYRPSESRWSTAKTVSIEENLHDGDDSAGGVGITRQWHGCYEAMHPRTLLYCNASLIQIVDERRPELIGSRGIRKEDVGQIIFNDKIRCASNVHPGTFCFALATDKSVKLYDVRKLCLTDPIFSWKHGMASSPSWVEISSDFRRAFVQKENKNNKKSSSLAILAVSNETGDAMTFETQGTNDVGTDPFSLSALSAGVRLVPQFADAPWGGFQFCPGERKEYKHSRNSNSRGKVNYFPYFAWSEEATGNVYVQNLGSVQENKSSEDEDSDEVPLSFGYARRSINQGSDTHSRGKYKPQPVDIVRQLDDDHDLLPHLYNGSSKYVAIDAAWKREEEMLENMEVGEDKDEDYDHFINSEIAYKANEALILAKKIKNDQDLREVRLVGKIKKSADLDKHHDAYSRITIDEASDFPTGALQRENKETGEMEVIFDGRIRQCPIHDCVFKLLKCKEAVKQEKLMSEHLWDVHKVQGRSLASLRKTVPRSKQAQEQNRKYGKQKLKTATMSYNYVSVVGNDMIRDYPEHLQSKRDAKEEFWREFDQRASERENEDVLKAAVDKTSSIEFERYNMIKSADIMNRLQNLRENGWGIMINDDDEENDREAINAIKFRDDFDDDDFPESQKMETNKKNVMNKKKEKDQERQKTKKKEKTQKRKVDGFL